MVGLCWQLESESAANHDVYYTISGRGYNQSPVNVFAFDTDTGKLSALKTIDREEFPSFTVRWSKLWTFQAPTAPGSIV